MEGLTCDACGRALLADEDVRYVLRLQGFAAYDPLEVTAGDLRGDLGVEIRSLVEDLENVDAGAARDAVARAFRFDLCPGCWARWVEDPLAGLR